MRRTVCTVCLLLFCICCCKQVPDEDHLQICTDPESFKPFLSTSRNVVLQPYVVLPTQDSVIVAWEEKTLDGHLRHVEVEVEGLMPATTYFYRVNGADRDGRFVTAPEGGTAFSFFVFGDTRTGNDISGQIVDLMLSVDPDAAFVLHTGDMVYDGESFQSWLDDWWFPMRDLTARFTVFPTMGNHELNSSFYKRYFSSLGGEGRNYSFVWGDVCFIILDTNKENFGSNGQLPWLQDELEKAGTAEMTVLSHHIPVYFSSPNASISGMEYLQDVLPVLYENHEVSIAFSGDVHSYQHHLKNGVHYLISAGGGEKQYEPGLPLEGMTLGLGSVYHFTHCSVSSGQMTVTTCDLSGDVLEQFSFSGAEKETPSAKITAEAGLTEAAPLDTFQMDVYVEGVFELDTFDVALGCSRDEPEAVLDIIDADAAHEGIQAIPGSLNGRVVRNEADGESGIVHYREENIGGTDGSRLLVLSVTLQVPENAPVAAIYLIPRCTLYDTAGKRIQHFLGGVSIRLL